MTEHLDVAIIGAGISGISAAYFLGKDSPDRSYAIIEKRSAIGGTWDLFNYPGIRSDSDMQTMGFSFKPWLGDKSIAPGKEIKAYVEETAQEFGIMPHIRFGLELKSSSWDSTKGFWTLTLVDDKGQTKKVTCTMLLMCNGYYSYEEGYRPKFPGEQSFKGKFIHPQLWPKDLDYSGKKVVIIGSGATAVTLLPNMADKTKHITMLQRTPTYLVSSPESSPLTKKVMKLFGPKLGHWLLRSKNIVGQRFMYELAMRRPNIVKTKLLDMAAEALPEGYDVLKHFTPPYNPWKQRMCLIPDNDFFNCIKEGKASVATGNIKTFTEHGIELEDGEKIEADIVVTATGLNMRMFNHLDFEIDGEKLDVSKRFLYKGCMLGNVPNLVITMGYANASWTLKADITSRFVCRLLNQLKRHGYDRFYPNQEHVESSGESIFALDSSYLKRVKDQLPKQGSKAPWRINHNYFQDYFILTKHTLEDGVMKFTYPEASKKAIINKKAA